MNFQVKICGITQVEDAQAAVAAGADLLGFVFCAQSPRNIAPAAAAKIISQLPAQVGKVGLFVNAEAETIRRTAQECGLTLLQLHGEETPEFCAQFTTPVMKAFRVRDAGSLAALPAYRVQYWLLDAYVAGKAGGTGQSFEWELAVSAVKQGPVFLAGGLTPENVARAVRQVRPFGVDVSSGVESAPGKKDPAKVAAFIQAARSALLS